MSGFFNSPAYGQILRLDLAWAMQGLNTVAASALPGSEAEAVKVMANSGFARFILASI